MHVGPHGDSRGCSQLSLGHRSGPLRDWFNIPSFCIPGGEKEALTMQWGILTAPIVPSILGWMGRDCDL